MGGPSNFIVNQSPNPWILGFEILDFGLDNFIPHFCGLFRMEMGKNWTNLSCLEVKLLQLHLLDASSV